MVAPRAGMSGGGLWALDTSNSFGRSPSTLRGNTDVSLLSPQSDSFSNSSKVASALRGSPSALSTTASFYGSGISDLRSAVVAQQRQHDTLIDKVAALLAAMHAELTHDLRGMLEGGYSGRMEELRKASSELDCRTAEITSRLQELREAESRDCSLAHAQGEQDRLQTREWLSHEMQLVAGQFTEEVQALHERIDIDLRNSNQRLVTGLEDVQQQLCSRTCSLEEGVGNNLRELHERLQGQDLQQEITEGQFRSMNLRMVALEERLLGTPGPLDLPLRPTPEEETGAQGQRRDRLDRLEANARRQDAALERFEDTIRGLQRSEVVSSDREAQAQEWRRQVEGRLESASTAEARVHMLEQWRKRAEERFERLTGHLQPVPSQGRAGGTEQRVDALYERVESLTALLQQQVRQGSAGVPGARSVETRMDECAEKVEALSVAIERTSRQSGHREQHLSEKLEDVCSRVGGLEGFVESLRKQASSRHSTGNEGNSRSLQIQAAFSSLAGNLRQDLEAQLLRATENLAQGVATDLQHQLDSRIDAAQEDLLERLDRSQQALREQTQDLEGRTAQLHTASQRLTDETCQLRHELELRVAQSQGAAQRRSVDPDAPDWERGQEVRLGEVTRSVQQLRDEVDGKMLPSVQAEVQRLLSGQSREHEARLGEVCRNVQQLGEEVHGQLLSNMQSGVQRLLFDHSRDHEARLVELRRQVQQISDEVRRCETEGRVVERKLGSEVQSLIAEHRREQEELRVSVQRLSEDLRRGLAEAATASTSATLLSSQAPRVQLDGEMELLRRQNAALREEVEGFQLERKVARCMAGLERGRSPCAAESAAAGAPITPPAPAGRQPRKAASADSAPTRRRREEGPDPHSLSFLQKQQIFEPGAATLPSSIERTAPDEE